jgi:hypothetical protein
MTLPYVIHFPDYFDDYAGEIEAKGYFADVIVESAGLRYNPVFYDPIRFEQEYKDHLASGARAFSEPNIVVVGAVTRQQIEAAIEELSQRSFHALAPEASEHRADKDDV